MSKFPSRRPATRFSSIKKSAPLWDALCAVLRVYANVHHTMIHVNEVIQHSFIRTAIMSILPEAAHIHAEHDE